MSCTAGGRAACRGRTPLPEGDGRVSWADSTAGGRGPRVVGGLHCRRERAEYRGRTPLRRKRAECCGRTPLPEGEGQALWRTPLPEGDGRVSWADSAAGGRGPNIWLPGGEPSVVGEEIDGQG